ncbi:hypothetical protein NDU88_001287 [Pleurodeles waltl]|uniref:MULE transposase domain-containing protein n=1 Tax=Pleurodeles waltl TaxID=8319 RepID=A0AAV7MJA8_PLEWA|nr:hypothetical protein NDU88_001287 [Pleurodeles waltl]
MEQCTTRQNIEEAADIPHKAVKALCESGVPLHQTDGPIGELIRQLCPAARTMCKSSKMYEKYLPEVYGAQIANMRRDVANVPISLTVDETTEVHGDPATGTLVTYYTDDAEKDCCSALVGFTVSDEYNSAKIAFIVNNVLWVNHGMTLLLYVSDSASYMTKTVDDLHAAQRVDFFHIKDPCHLIHAAVSHALSQPEKRNMYDFVIKAGAVLKYG